MIAGKVVESNKFVKFKIMENKAKQLSEFQQTIITYDSNIVIFYFICEKKAIIKRELANYIFSFKFKEPH